MVMWTNIQRAQDEEFEPIFQIPRSQTFQPWIVYIFHHVKITTHSAVSALSSRHDSAEFQNSLNESDQISWKIQTIERFKDF